MKYSTAKSKKTKSVRPSSSKKRSVGKSRPYAQSSKTLRVRDPAIPTAELEKQEIERKQKERAMKRKRMLKLYEKVKNGCYKKP